MRDREHPWSKIQTAENTTSIDHVGELMGTDKETMILIFIDGPAKQFPSKPHKSHVIIFSSRMNWLKSGNDLGGTTLLYMPSWSKKELQVCSHHLIGPEIQETEEERKKREEKFKSMDSFKYSIVKRCM